MILDIFFDLIAAAGPFTVFYGMGQNSCSGKLLFRGLSSSDNSATFIEDSYGLTISSAGGGGGFPIDLNEIVYGTGTGITSSFLKVDNVNYSITGAGIINTTPRGNTNTLNSFIELSNSQIIGGKENLIQNLNSSQLKDSVILGGLKNCLRSNTSSILCNSVIAGGTYNVMAYGIENSVILGGTQNSICTPLFNSKSNDIIHSSSNAQIYKSENSNIHSSCDVCMRYSCNSFISTSSNNLIGDEITMRFQNSSSVISSRCSQILATGSNNTIISSYKSNIAGNGATLSTILSSVSSLIDSAIDSNIIGGNNQCIVAFGPTKSSDVFQSNIIGGCSNLIYSGSPNKVGYANFFPVSPGKYNYDFTKSIVKNSTIIGGYKNCIQFRPPSRSIIAFRESSTVDVGDLNSIIGGYNNEINISLLSTTIGGKNNKIICETLSAIMGGYKNYIYAGLSIGKSNNNFIYSKRAGSGHNSIIGGRENRIYTIPDIYNNTDEIDFAGSAFTSIIGSKGGEITRSYTSTIIGSVNSKIQVSIFPPSLGFTISNSTILSGCDNRICSEIDQPAQETTIIAGYRNCTGNSLNSNMKAFTTIASTRTRPQNSDASAIISSSGKPAGFLSEQRVIIQNSKNSLIISSCNSHICDSENSLIISSYCGKIYNNACNSIILASSNGLSLTWSNTVLVQNLLVSCNTFVATASTNQFIKESAPGFNGTITSGTVNVRHGLITTI
jgi:hypothetical protein